MTFYEELVDADKAKMLALYRLLGDRGQIRNREKFKKLEDDVWEFKSNQIRMPCAFLSNKVVVVTHGFFKKANDVPPAEIKRARRILSEDAEISKP